ncbi:enoyl-CoA hydratase [Ralstonia pickettii]|nr:enoyl-CoA hydratase [Ralstonia pickettii]
MSTIKQEVKNNVAYLTIQSPPANALSSQIIKDLQIHFDEMEANAQVKAVVLKGEGRFFSAGADIKEFTSLQKAADYESLSLNGQQVFQRIEDYKVPVIAAIHGAALGGGLELAMSCHIRLVSENAKIGLPELNLGIIPGFAGTQRLAHYVGTAKAYEMLLTGEAISGKNAAACGLANKAISEEDLFAEAEKMAESIAAKSKPTIQAIMELLSYGRSNRIAEGAKAEAKAFGKVFGSEDAKEGIQAFLEKRKANFQDK